MTVLGIKTLQPRIPNFKFSYNFFLCDRLPKTELLFGIDVQKNSHYPMPGTEKRIAAYRSKVDF